MDHAYTGGSINFPTPVVQPQRAPLGVHACIARRLWLRRAHNGTIVELAPKIHDLWAWLVHVADSNHLFDDSLRALL